VTMRSHCGTRSAWLSAAITGVLACTVIAGVFAGTATAAQALPPGAVTVSASPQSGDVQAPDTAASYTVTVTNADPLKKAENVMLSVTAPGELSSYVDVSVEGCDGVDGTSVNCGTIEPAAQKTFTITATPKSTYDLAEGQTKSGTITVTLSSPNTTSTTATINVLGIAQNATGISGIITDIKDEKPLEGVKVTAKAGGDDLGSATSGADGKWEITGDVPPGEVTVSYSKDGYEKEESEATAEIGKPVTFEARMTKKQEDKPTEAPATEAAPEPTGADDGLGLTTWLLIILGVLLVIGGIVAIVMLIRKGKDDDEDDDDSPLPDTPASYRPSAAQTGQLGVYDAARQRPGMDSPTMIHNGPLINDDDLARYGSEPAGGGFGPAYDDSRTQLVDPSQGRGGDAGATRMYPASGDRDDAATRPFSAGGYGSQPTSGPGYGSQPTSGPAYGSQPTSGYGGGAAGGYGSQPTSGPAYGSQPTSGSAYGSQPTSGAGYPASGGGYGAGQPGGGYGSQPTSGSAYGSGGGYGGRDDNPAQGPRDDRGGQNQWGSGYDDQSQPPRRYREDDDYDDRPRSW
jgi:hypothetical protein